MLQNVASINSYCLAVQILVCCNEEYGISHVAIIARTLSKDLAFKVLLGKLRFLVLTTLALGHFRGEDTRSDRVDSDLEAIVANLEAKHLGEMDNSSL